MSAANGFVRGDRDEPRPDGAPTDLDRIQDITVAVGGFVLAMVGAVGGALALGYAFAPWVGFLELLGVGLLVTGYSLAAAARRRAERERQARFAEKQERAHDGGPRKIAVISEDLD